MKHTLFLSSLSSCCGLLSVITCVIDTPFKDAKFCSGGNARRLRLRPSAEHTRKNFVNVHRTCGTTEVRANTQTVVFSGRVPGVDCVVVNCNLEKRYHG